MKHRDRETLIVELARLVEGVDRSASSQQRTQHLAEQIHPLLDHFLLESQPIEERDASILIADIRGFTALADSESPATIARLLHRFFNRMVFCVQAHGGIIDKFMGDAVMALFGVPDARDDHLLSALACAVEMQHAMLDLNRASQTMGDPAIFAGIAVNNGPMLVGSFGSTLYSEYTAIGDTVNMTARMQGFSLRGQIMINQASYLQVREQVDVGEPNRVLLKGKRQEITLYELIGMRKPTANIVPRVEIRRSPRVQVDCAVSVRQLAPAHQVAQPIKGHVKDLGYMGLSADLSSPLEPGQDVWLGLGLDASPEPTLDITARILRCRPCEEGYRVSLQFSRIDSAEHRLIKQYVDQVIWGR
ncbi:guanylate cyclase [Thiocapsa imhoffii]|uniref:Guanylate cyclase n=1 Tax=Thiocapsa imhoffii TaxID=382777 RepID=A0A9X0WK63_9GAMM|nr:adenylate/guanylate cyclase domain-containing protein [Thiocapsa imhoffii]MBK1646000.1 guanylate cyclase [Thiocapsa imhoffii]